MDLCYCIISIQRTIFIILISILQQKYYLMTVMLRIITCNLAILMLRTLSKMVLIGNLPPVAGVGFLLLLEKVSHVHNTYLITVNMPDSCVIIPMCIENLYPKCPSNIKFINKSDYTSTIICCLHR